MSSWYERLKESTERRSQDAQRNLVITRAQKVGGKPWWECSLPQFVAEYKSVDALNAEFAIAAEHGWEIDDTTAVGGHINVGRTVTGAALTGGLSLLFGASRSRGRTTITWKRVAQRSSSPDDDVTVKLQRLVDLRDRGALTASEFAIQKQRLLDA